MARVAVFRVDAARAIGAGHVYRCLALADAMTDAGWRCLFACGRGTREAVSALGRSRHEVIELDTLQESIRLKNCYPDGVNLLVVDHYGLDVGFEAGFRPWAQRILVLDDEPGRRHDCDFLLDQNLGGQSEAYRGRIPDHCRLLVGPSYALLRPQFLVERRKALARRAEGEPAHRLLISLGATDPMNITSRIVAATADLPLEIDVVLGANSTQLHEIRGMALLSGSKLRIHLDVTDMAALMSAADLAVGAGGSTSWERCCLGLPTAVLVLADNQRRIAELLDRSGVARNLGPAEHLVASDIRSAVQELSENAERRRTMAMRAASICDGRGTQRVLLALLGSVAARDGRPIVLRAASLADDAMVLEWQRHPETRRYSRNSAVPTAEEHHQWMNGRLSLADSIFTIVECGETPAGVLRLDRRSGTANSHEVSILVAPDHFRRGIGSGALQLARQLLPNADLVAEVQSQNEASMKLFSSAGYHRYDDGLLHSPPMPQ